MTDAPIYGIHPARQRAEGPERSWVLGELAEAVARLELEVADLRAEVAALRRRADPAWVRRSVDGVG